LRECLEHWAPISTAKPRSATEVTTADDPACWRRRDCASGPQVHHTFRSGEARAPRGAAGWIGGRKMRQRPRSGVAARPLAHRGPEIPLAPRKNCRRSPAKYFGYHYDLPKRGPREARRRWLEWCKAPASVGFHRSSFARIATCCPSRSCRHRVDQAHRRKCGALQSPCCCATQ